MIITSLTAGIILVLFGVLVWKFKLVTLFAGRRQGQETDKVGLAGWIGKNMMFMGFVVMISAIIQLVIFQENYLIVDTAIIVLLSIRMAKGTAKFSKPRAKTSKKAIAREKKRPKN